MYKIGFGLIANAKFCKQLLIVDKIHIGIRNADFFWLSVPMYMYM